MVMVMGVDMECGAGAAARPGPARPGGQLSGKMLADVEEHVMCNGGANLVTTENRAVRGVAWRGVARRGAMW